MRVRPARARGQRKPPAARRPDADGPSNVGAYNLLLLIVAIVLVLIAAEVLLRSFRPLADPYWRYKIRPENTSHYIPSQFAPNLNLRLTNEPGLPGMAREVRFTLNNMGFRGDSMVVPKPADEYRVFVVGGSTTECLYLDDAVAFPRVVQDSLRALYPDRNIRIYGAGKSGDRSYDHLAMLAHRIAHLQPDLVILFPGVNDLLAAINQQDYLFYIPNVPPEERDWSFAQLVRFTTTEFHVGRLFFGLLKPSSYRQVVEEIKLQSDFRRYAELRRSLPVSPRPPETNLPAYRVNLRSFVGLARAHGAEVLLLTQATTWNSRVDPAVERWHWMNSGPGVSYAPADMDAAMEAYNHVVRQTASALQVPVFDLAARLPKSLEFFYDDVHFNVKGSAAAGIGLANFIRDAGLVREPARNAAQ